MSLMLLKYFKSGFIFIPAGWREKYHIVWETLNSEEATYIWHFDKTMNALRAGLNEIERILKQIKATNKQQYLSKEHSNFSRVIHDYADLSKGVVLWKGMLGE